MEIAAPRQAGAARPARTVVLAASLLLERVAQAAHLLRASQLLPQAPPQALPKSPPMAHALEPLDRHVRALHSAIVARNTAGAGLVSFLVCICTE